MVIEEFVKLELALPPRRSPGRLQHGRWVIGYRRRGLSPPLFERPDCRPEKRLVHLQGIFLKPVLHIFGISAEHYASRRVLYR
jgi:hypothetical protein